MTVRAVIGDQLRMPVMWCEMGSCISWHADPAALGEADTRARAIDAGRRIDAFGRLACPGASRPTRASGPPARSCRGTGTPPSPGPPGPPCAATAPPPPGGTAVTPAARPAAIPPPGRRSRDGISEYLRSRVGGPEGGPGLAPVSVSHRDRPGGDGGAPVAPGGQHRLPLADAGRGDGRPGRRQRRSPPDPARQAGPARRGSPRARSAHRPDRSVLRGTSPSPRCAGGARHTAARTSRSWCRRW